MDLSRKLQEDPLGVFDELEQLGPRAAEFLPELGAHLAQHGWEEYGPEEWAERELLRSGWALYRRWASLGELREALHWPNTLAVVEASEELWQRGEPCDSLTEALMLVVAGGRWSVSAGDLLRRMGPEVAGLDESLILLLEEGKLGAARALGQRRPEVVVQKVRAGLLPVPPAGELADYLQVAGNEVVPVLLRVLVAGRADLDDPCQSALEGYSDDQLREWGRRLGNLTIPYGVRGRLAACLWSQQPARLAAWAHFATLPQFAYALEHAPRVRLKLPLRPDRPKELAFAAAMGDDYQVLAECLGHQCPEVIWCGLARLPAAPEWKSRLRELWEHPEEMIWRKAMDLCQPFDQDEPPGHDPHQLVESLTHRPSRRLRLRCLRRHQDLWGVRRVLLPTLLKCLLEEVRLPSPEPDLVEQLILTLKDAQVLEKARRQKCWTEIEAAITRLALPNP